MKHLFFALSLALSALASPARAIVGFSGATWGTVTDELTGLNGAGTQGFLRQGVDLVRLPGDVLFRASGYYRWRFQSLNQTYYDKHGAGLGVELDKGPFTLGVEHDWSRYTSLGASSNDFAAYLSYFKGWDLGLSGFPGSTWGFLSHDLNGIDGSGMMGFVRQGADFYRALGATASVFGGFGWRLRDLNQLYYNETGPSIGVDVRRGPVRAGVEYDWKHYPELHQSTESFQLYFSWYLSWDRKLAP